jgi:hypothetical protein
MLRGPVGLILSAMLLFVSASGALAAAPAMADFAVLSPPLRADLPGIIDASPTGWRSAAAEVYRWTRFPDILIVDSASFAVQDRLFSRLAYYLEKSGFRGRLLTNAQLAGRHGWNAHDYGAAGLADFFSAAVATSFPLNPEEIALRRLSLQEGIIFASRSGYDPGKGGILGISQSSSRVERELLLTHESFHGVFFSSAEYRDFCQGLWDSLSPELRSFYESFLGSLGYDIGAPTLVINEFQAYLMQQPLSYAAGYFQRFLALQEARGRTVAAWQLLQNADSLDGFLKARFGFGAGGPLLASVGSESR